MISTLPDSIGIWVDLYEQSLVFDFCTNPYLFAMQSCFERGLSSSAWTQCVKSCFDRWSGIAAPPKQVWRSSWFEPYEAAPLSQLPRSLCDS